MTDREHYYDVDWERQLLVELVHAVDDFAIELEENGYRERAMDHRECGESIDTCDTIVEAFAFMVAHNINMLEAMHLVSLAGMYVHWSVLKQ